MIQITELTCRPKRSLLVLVGAVAGLAAGLAATEDQRGRVLFALIALAALAALVWLVVVRDSLRADAAGVSVVDGWRVAFVEWAEVEAIRADATRRRGGLTAHSLEIDLGEHLVVVPEWLLGEPAAEVAAALTALSRTGQQA